jgi:hypothetical protein
VPRLEYLLWRPDAVPRHEDEACILRRTAIQAGLNRNLASSLSAQILCSPTPARPFLLDPRHEGLNRNSPDGESLKRATVEEMGGGRIRAEHERLFCH